jgi:hypothetical protein
MHKQQVKYNIHVVVSWVMAQCSLVGGYQRCGETRYHHPYSRILI